MGPPNDAPPPVAQRLDELEDVRGSRARQPGDRVQVRLFDLERLAIRGRVVIVIDTCGGSYNIIKTP